MYARLKDKNTSDFKYKETLDEAQISINKGEVGRPLTVEFINGLREHYAEIRYDSIITDICDGFPEMYRSNSDLGKGDAYLPCRVLIVLDLRKCNHQYKDIGAGE